MKGLSLPPACGSRTKRRDGMSGDLAIALSWFLQGPAIRQCQMLHERIARKRYHGSVLADRLINGDQPSLRGGIRPYHPIPALKRRATLSVLRTLFVPVLAQFVFL